MKKIIFLLFIVLIIFSYSACSNNKNSQAFILSINDIQSDPLAFTGEIIINGVVSVFSPFDEKMFGIKDTAELLFCKNLDCGSFMLPVKYIGEGAMPKLADEVNITGSWKEVEDGFIFEVTEIEVKRNVMAIIES